MSCPYFALVMTHVGIRELLTTSYHISHSYLNTTLLSSVWLAISISCQVDTRTKDATLVQIVIVI